MLKSQNVHCWNLPALPFLRSSGAERPQVLKNSCAGLKWTKSSNAYFEMFSGLEPLKSQDMHCWHVPALPFLRSSGAERPQLLKSSCAGIYVQV